MSYVQSLNNPFEFGPLKLGYDVILPTVLMTAYRRAAIQVNADGSFAIAMTPSATNMVLTNNSGASTTVWVTQNASNVGAITNQTDSCRVVSGGLRLFCLFAETAAPGVLFAGQMAQVTRTSITAQSPNTLLALPEAELGLGTRGAAAMIYPIDNSSFEMWTSPAAGYSVGTYPYSSSVFITGSGFPAGTVVWYESILNLEGYPNPVSTTTSGLSDSQLGDYNSTPASFFPTPTALMAAVRGALSNPVIMDAVELGAHAANPGLGSAVSSIRGAFGHGRNINSARSNHARLVAGDSERVRGREQSVVIEEVKSEAGVYERRDDRRRFRDEL